MVKKGAKLSRPNKGAAPKSQQRISLFFSCVPASHAPASGDPELHRGPAVVAVAPTDERATSKRPPSRHDTPIVLVDAGRESDASGLPCREIRTDPGRGLAGSPPRDGRDELTDGLTGIAAAGGADLAGPQARAAGVPPVSRLTRRPAGAARAPADGGGGAAAAGAAGAAPSGAAADVCATVPAELAPLKPPDPRSVAHRPDRARHDTAILGRTPRGGESPTPPTRRPPLEPSAAACAPPQTDGRCPEGSSVGPGTAIADTVCGALGGGGAAAREFVACAATETMSAHGTPRKRRRLSSAEENLSDVLFESMDEVDFSSPFKEEVVTRASPPPPPPQSADPSVPRWRQFDRYSVKFVERCADGSTVVSLEATDAGRPNCTASLRGSWAETQVQSGDIVHLLDAPGHVVDNLSGQLVVNPDILMAGTSVVAAVFCMRKAVLNELFKGMDAGGKAMLVGTIVHQLFQQVVRERVLTVAGVTAIASDLLRQLSVVSSAYGSRLDERELAAEVRQFVAPTLGWVRRYAAWGGGAEVAPPAEPPGGQPDRRADWAGRVTAVRDIEENCWSPRLGIKGKIDLTVEVKCRGDFSKSSKVVPLELKTGRPSFSAEHQGQLTLYSMMTSERRDDPGSGLLLYLRDGSMRQVPSGQHQQRDLLQLRNTMVHHLSRPPVAADGGDVQLPALPPVIANQRACQQCPHLLACSAYQRPGDRPHAVPSATSHLTADHLDYFLRWSALVRLETAAGAARASMARLWCRPPAERQARGQALAACRLQAVRRAGDAWLHQLSRPAAASAAQLAEGELVLLSTDRHLALAMGTLTELTDAGAAVLLDRDLSSYPGGADERYHVDKYEYQAGTVSGTYLANLARLLEDRQETRRMRELIVDRSPPAFLPGLGRVVIQKCRTILRPLNKLQQRALLRTMMAKDYLLILGMPGTGKTSTIVALVRLLVTLGRSVLLASYTHSAVDTVLLKLKETFTDFVRLGRAGRVHADLRPFCADLLTADLTGPERMADFYDSKPVVATTCLGVNHPVFQRRRFDICIIDEASQIVQPAALGPLLKADRFVLVGDPQQLPPVIQSAEARRGGMDESLFARLAASDNTVQLTVQYRMNRTLMMAANHLTYDGRLSCGSQSVEEATLPSVERKADDPVWLAAALEPALERSLLLLDTSRLDWRHQSDRQGDVRNTAEAALVVHITTALVERGVPIGSVGVMAPFRGQVKLLRASLPADLEVNTVDQYQGRDKSVILYSCTRSTPRRTTDQTDVDSTDILSDERRLTVAVTRAKHKLVLVGCRDALASYAPFGRLFRHLGAEDVIRLTPCQLWQEMGLLVGADVKTRFHTNLETWLLRVKNKTGCSEGEAAETLLGLLDDGSNVLCETPMKNSPCIVRDEAGYTVLVEQTQVAQVGDLAETLLIAGMCSYIFHQKVVKRNKSFMWFMSSKVFEIESESVASPRAMSNIGKLIE